MHSSRSPERAPSAVLDRFLDLVPGLFAFPILFGVALSMVRLIGTGAPDLEYDKVVDLDAQALYLGQPLFQDPAAGYTGVFYNPLIPGIVSLLDRIELWAGWSVLIGTACGVGLIALAAWLAYVPVSADRLARLTTGIGAVGMGALAWWGVSHVGASMLMAGRADQFVWFCSFVALALVAASTPRSRVWPLAGGVVLLTLAFWAKQSAFVASIAATGWLIVTALTGWMPWRRVAGFAGGLLALNAAVLGVLNLLTDGWEYRFNFELPTRQTNITSIPAGLRDGMTSISLSAMILVAIVVAVVAGLQMAGHAPWSRWRTARASELLEAATGRQRVAGALVLALPLLLLFAVYFRQKQGGLDNQFVGVTWALGLLAAAAWGEAAQAATARRLAAGVVGAGFVAALLLGSAITSRGYTVPPLNPAVTWPEIPADLREYAQDHSVYHPIHADLNVKPRREIATSYYNAVDLLAAGWEPTSLREQILDRKFDAVGTLPLVQDRYSSAYGKWEEGYIWKLNRVIEARYERRAGVPGGLLVRRPGPEQAVWMRDCFGPFEAGGVTWRIGRGGGFWCQTEAGAPITQRGAAAPVTQLRTRAPVRSARGSLILRVPAGTAIVRLVGGGSGWSVTVRHAKGEDAATVRVGRDRPVKVPAGSGSVVEVRFARGSGARPGARGRVDVPAPPVDGSTKLAIETTAGTRLVADLRDLRLEAEGDDVDQ